MCAFFSSDDGMNENSFKNIKFALRLADIAKAVCIFYATDS